MKTLSYLLQQKLELFYMEKLLKMLEAKQSQDGATITIDGLRECFTKINDDLQTQRSPLSQQSSFGEMIGMQSKTLQEWFPFTPKDVDSKFLFNPATDVYMSFVEFIKNKIHIWCPESKGGNAKLTQEFITGEAGFYGVLPIAMSLSPVALNKNGFDVVQLRTLASTPINLADFKKLLERHIKVRQRYIQYLENTRQPTTDPKFINYIEHYYHLHNLIALCWWYSHQATQETPQYYGPSFRPKEVPLILGIDIQAALANLRDAGKESPTLAEYLRSPDSNNAAFEASLLSGSPKPSNGNPEQQPSQARVSEEQKQLPSATASMLSALAPIVMSSPTWASIICHGIASIWHAIANFFSQLKPKTGKQGDSTPTPPSTSAASVAPSPLSKPEISEQGNKNYEEILKLRKNEDERREREKLAKEAARKKEEERKQRWLNGVRDGAEKYDTTPSVAPYTNGANAAPQPVSEVQAPSANSAPIAANSADSQNNSPPSFLTSACYFFFPCCDPEVRRRKEAEKEAEEKALEAARQAIISYNDILKPGGKRVVITH